MSKLLTYFLHPVIIASSAGLVVLIDLLALAQISTASPEDEGSAIDVSEIPYQVSLLYPDYFCGGTLIAPTTVITAAICTFGKIPDLIAVRIGSNYHDEDGELIPVVDTLEHPDFIFGTFDKDVALVTLASASSFTTQFATLPSEATVIEDGASALVSGWGNTFHSADETTRVLQAVHVPIVNHDECKKLYEGHYVITEHMICASAAEESGLGTCLAGVGGPLTLDGVLIGIVSFGVGCWFNGLPGVYTSVPSVLEWISQQVDV